MNHVDWATFVPAEDAAMVPREAYYSLRARGAELEGELAEKFQQYVDANEARIDAEAQTKRYREALEHIAHMAHPQFSAEIARKALEGGE